MALSPTDVGHRVVVRRRLAAESASSGRPIYGDVLGILESWAEGTILIRRTDGAVTEIAEQDVVAGKLVPPAPPPRRPRRSSEPEA
jgi:N-acetylglutamate synthase